MGPPVYFPIIFFFVVIFNIFGQFGNINIIVLHLKRPSLRTHYGCLLLILSSCQSICLLFEFVNIYFALDSYFQNTVIYRDDCFHVIFAYVFFMSFQADTVAAISIDFLFCLCFPLKYRSFQRNCYLPVLLALPFLHSAYLVFFANRYLDHAPIRLCNPPSTLFPDLSKVNYIINLLVATTTLTAYFLGFLTLYLKTRSKERVDIERKVLRSISVLVVIFLFNRFLGMLLVNILNFLNVSNVTKSATLDLLVIAALICLSQNFYVCYYRSSEYRNMLNSQLSWLIRFVRSDYSPSSNVGWTKSMTTCNHNQFRMKTQSSLVITVP